MRIVAEAASIGDLAERLARPRNCAAVKKMRGTVQAKRIDEFAAGRTALGEKASERSAARSPLRRAASTGPKSGSEKPSLITPQMRCE